MYTNSDFKNLVEQGKTPWEAVSVLTDKELEAMFLWVTAILYQFKECMSLPTQILNIKMIQWIGPVLNHMKSIDRTWGGGAIQFSLSLHYGILPGYMGGSDELSSTYLQQAIEIGPDWLLGKWGRAKYFHVMQKNKTGFIEDLQWVIAQDPDLMKDEYAWKIYFQDDARRSLDEIDSYF